MHGYAIAIDLRDGLVVDADGFNHGISSEGHTRLEAQASFHRASYRFYLSGRVYSHTNIASLGAWIDSFQPSTISSWVREIDGDLTIIVVDTHNRRAYIIADRNGLVRSYYSYSSGRLYVSNSRHELIRLLGMAKLSCTAAYQLLTLGYVIDPESLLDNVLVTMPGQVIIADENGWQAERYYSPVHMEAEYFKTESECVEALDSAYRRVFGKRLGTARAPIVMLSGGIDSLTMMKYVRACYGKTVASVTYSFKGLYPNEIEPARIAARHFGTEHHEVVIDPADAGVLFVQTLQTDTADGNYLTSLAIQQYLSAMGGSFDLFTGQDTRLHTPPFDNPRELGIYLNRQSSSASLLRLFTGIASQLLSQWPLEGPLKHYLQYWAKNLRTRSDFSTYLLLALTPFMTPDVPGVAGDEFHRLLVRQMPKITPEDGLQEIFKKYVNFEYRAQYTDDMNGLESALHAPSLRVHCPFYDWEAVTESNRVPYQIGMRGDITFKTWNKMPYVRKRVARLLVKDSVPEILLYRAKKTCPHFDLIYNNSIRATVQSILTAWAPALLASVEPELRDVISAYMVMFSSKPRFSLYDEGLLRRIQGVCYLAVLQQLCQNPRLQLKEELESITGLRSQAALSHVLAVH